MKEESLSTSWHPGITTSLAATLLCPLFSTPCSTWLKHLAAFKDPFKQLNPKPFFSCKRRDGEPWPRL